MAGDIKYGLSLGSTNWQVMKERAVLADRSGFHCVFLTDHLVFPFGNGDCLETWTAASILAGMTENVRFGFAMLNPSFRNAAVLAKMGATFDMCSNGRLIYSLGAGYHLPDYEQYNLPYVDSAEERPIIAKEVGILSRMLWTSQEPVTYEGKYVRAKECRLGVWPVQKPHPPIWYGGDSMASRLAMDELTGEGAAGGWYMHIQPLEDNMAWFRANSRHRDEPDFTLCVSFRINIAATREEAEEEVRRTLTPHPRYEPNGFADTLRYTALGTVDQAVERMMEAVRLGVNCIIFNPMNQRTLDALATDVIPAMNEAARSSVAAAAP